jgi:hypothetical protein
MAKKVKKFVPVKTVSEYWDRMDSGEDVGDVVVLDGELHQTVPYTFEDEVRANPMLEPLLYMQDNPKAADMYRKSLRLTVDGKFSKAQDLIHKSMDLAGIWYNPKTKKIEKKKA